MENNRFFHFLVAERHDHIHLNARISRGLDGRQVQLTEVAMEPPTQFSPNRGRGRPETARA